MDYTLIRSERKTISIQVQADGAVTVRAPRRMDRRQIDEAVARHAGWIEKKRQGAAKAAPAPEQRLSGQELAELKEQARADLTERVRRLAPAVGVSWSGISIRSQRTRWGSCTAKGVLNFNCLLMLCPPEIRDYVVLHELCHRLQMNHSKAFWAEVSRVMPDWPARRRWLRQNGSAVLRRMTG